MDGGGYGPIQSDRLIDLVIRFVSPEVYEWVQTVWVQRRGVGEFPPANGSYGNATTWTHFRTNFIDRFVTSATCQQVKQEFNSLKLGSSNVILFNHQCRKLLRVITVWGACALSSIRHSQDRNLRMAGKWQKD
jgi:hypothetical protein